MQRREPWDRDATQVFQIIALFVGIAVAGLAAGRCARPAYVSADLEAELLPKRESLDAVRQQLEADGMLCEQEADGFFWCTYPAENGSELAL